MVELILICMGMCNVHRLMNDQDSTWMSQVSGLRKELLPSLSKAQPTQSLRESPAPCLLVSWSELAPLRPEDFDLILLGPWGIDLIPCLLSLRGRLWITPRELQLHSLDQLSAAWCDGLETSGLRVYRKFWNISRRSFLDYFFCF